jgi:hypothetical protein
LSTRRQRAEDFNAFSENSEKIFNKFWNNLPDDDALRTENTFNICPKGAMGGLDETLIEIFFGFKYHSWQKKVGDNFNVTNEAKMIYGARLEYTLTDKAHVICILRPSKTDNLRPYEDGIVLEIVKEPSKLKDKSEQHWKYLIAYMRATDVDGQPSPADQLITFWLRKTKRCFYDGKLAPRKIFDKLGSIFSWAFSVGLSGALIFVITIWLNDSTDNEVVKRLDGITIELNSINLNQEKLLSKLNILKLITSNQYVSIQKQDDANEVLLRINRSNEDLLIRAVSSEQFKLELQKMRNTVLTVNESTAEAFDNIAVILNEKQAEFAEN